MSRETLKEEVQCPICTDTLKKPIRMLSCGHNLCHSCLVDLCRAEDNPKCPTCRNVVLLGSGGVNDVSRNYTIENMVDKILIDESEEPSNSLDSNNLKDQADSYMNEKNFKDAEKIFHVLMNQSEGFNKVQPSIKRAKCLLESGNIKEANEVYVELISIIDSCELAFEMKEIFEKCDEEIADAAEILLEKKQFEVSTSLTSCLHKIIKHFYNREAKLHKLKKVGEIIYTTAVKMKGNYKERSQYLKPLIVATDLVKDVLLSNNRRKVYFENQLQMLKDILEEMLNITDVDMEAKCLDIGWVMRYVEHCSHNVGFFTNNQNSVEILKQIIAIVKTTFGERACKYKLTAMCYGDLGRALKCLRRSKESKQSFIKAIELHETANDWLNEAEKNKSLTFAKNDLQTLRKTHENQNAV